MTDYDEIGRALLDVRKAYRLLYLFQRRLLDLAAQVSERLGQEFWWWLPAGDQAAIQGGTNPLERSAWKMLPLFGARFLYLPPGVRAGDPPQGGQWLLELILGPDDGEPEAGRGDPDPADFPDPTQCHSMIYLHARIIQADMPGKNWWSYGYEKSEWPELDEVAKDNDAGVRVIGLSRDLAVLMDPSAVDALADRFQELVKGQGGNVP
jgi:hypothetical protein